MANKILLRRNSTASTAPTAAQIEPGELAINTADGRLFTELNNGTIVNLPVQSIAGQAISPSSVTTTGAIAAATAAQVGTTGGTRIYISGGGGSNAISEYYLAEANPRWVIGRDLISGVSGGSGIGFNIGGANTLATNGAAVGRPANRSLGLYTSNGTSLTERVRIDSVGNVGISTTTPANSLHVVGTANTSTGHGVIVVANASTNATRVTHIGLPNDAHPFLAALNGTTTAATFGWGFFDSISSGNLEIKRRSGSTTWVDALAIDRVNGNVGIGTPEPAARLEVSGASTATASQTAGIFKILGSATNALTFGTLTGGPFAGYIQSGGSSTYPLSLNPLGGNVGINTTDPTSKFHLNNNGSTSSGFYADIGNAPGTTTLFEHTGTSTPVPFALRKSGWAGTVTATHRAYGILHLDHARSDVDVGANLHFTMRDSASNVQEYGGIGAYIVNATSSAERGNVVIYTTTSGATRNARVTVQHDGNVGIGTTSPQSSFHIFKAEGGVGTKDATITLGGYTTQGATIASYRYEGDSNSRGLMFSTRNTGVGMVDAVTITGPGDVGIGNTAPGSRLVVKGAGITTATSALNVTNLADASLLFVRNDGNVGVGTTAPDYKLHVNGSFAATTKSFRIKHPSKPNHILEYGSLESPYHGVRLTGRGKVSGSSGQVALPEYLKNLVHDDERVTIQLTNYRHGKLLYVSAIDLQHDAFFVACDTSSDTDLEFFWCLTAVRKDIAEMVVERATEFGF